MEAFEVSRIRGDSPYERQLLAHGECSATFRRLLTEIQASDLIVYVTARRLATRSLSGELQFVAATRTDRILRVLVGVSVERNQVVATLGHELQHALEVARAPAIRTRADFEDHYRRHGVRTGIADVHDTTEARHVERVIGEELGSAGGVISSPRCHPTSAREVAHLLASAR